jgi:hypothetical protein
MEAPSAEDEVSHDPPHLPPHMMNEDEAHRAIELARPLLERRSNLMFFR